MFHVQSNIKHKLITTGTLRPTIKLIWHNENEFDTPVLNLNFWHEKQQVTCICLFMY